ncbi:MAG TPA: sce7726 family protein [Arenimonas sp.]|uniref:sce7726 family protein n=1 Tax=Arenimonas sp. TaxID=1872635 RepID=UPI002BB28C79|nr:sce7726 family protein [Arenimonas sp.]HMB58001.1 sce7726 family protein [Arenimonas sp.]
MNTARDEKVRILQWLLPQLEDSEIVASELPFDGVRRKADLAVISSERLRAIEIKGPRDNVRTLPAQIDDYLEAFLEVDVAVASKFVPFVREQLPTAVGIIELAEDFVIRRRRASIHAALSSSGALQWLHSSDLRRLLAGSEYRFMSLVELRAAATRVPKSKLNSAALAAVFKRSEARYNAFLDERAERLNHDDIAVLETPQKIR